MGGFNLDATAPHFERVSEYGYNVTRFAAVRSLVGGESNAAWRRTPLRWSLQRWRWPPNNGAGGKRP